MAVVKAEGGGRAGNTGYSPLFFRARIGNQWLMLPGLLVRQSVEVCLLGFFAGLVAVYCEKQGILLLVVF